MSKLRFGRTVKLPGDKGYTGPFTTRPANDFGLSAIYHIHDGLSAEEMDDVRRRTEIVVVSGPNPDASAKAETDDAPSHSSGAVPFPA